jgi:hypothetical protein
VVGRLNAIVGHDHSAQTFLSFDELGVFQGDFQGVVELFEHSRWRAFGRIQAMPNSDFKAF